MFFSQATNGFYPASMKDQYDAAGTWPRDAVLVTPDEEAALRLAIQDGATLAHSSKGWVITPAAARPFAEVAAPRMASFRQNREISLNRLSGLGFAALQVGDTDLAQEVAAVRAALLDAPALPSVAGASTLDALDAALAAAWEGAYRDTSEEEIATAMAVGAGGGQTRPPT